APWYAMRGMLEKLASALTRFMQRMMPDPFVVAILLTLIAFGAALVHVSFDVPQVLVAWYDGTGKAKGFWNLLAFGMQMCLILVTGHALASSPPLRKALDALAGRARTPQSAIVIVACGAMVSGLVNWGLGLIAGALLAREVGRRCKARAVPVHYPLLAAAGYTGMLVWHGGLSGSAPLKVTLSSDLAQLLEAPTAEAIGAIPLGQTIGATPNLVVNAAFLLIVPWLLVRMLPADPAARIPAPSFDGDAPAKSDEKAPNTPAERLGRSRILAWLTCLAGIATWILIVREQGIGRLDPNLINFLFLFLGLALHGSLVAYGRAIGDAARGCAGIILQFPFYAGIMGVLAGTGLLQSIASAMASTGATLLPAVSFYSAGLVNLFVPSGGGQWAVQGPVLMDAALRTELSPARLVMALAYGDQWTNMLQPFWALPLLGITRVAARDIIGYTAVLLLVAQIPFLIALYVGW
ncbi:MAG: short-chain fatty acid transporter, partial [Myxococcota bacterium]